MTDDRALRAVLARQQLLNQQKHKRLARKIHDDVSQKMTLLSLQLSLASSDDGPPATWSADCQDWANLVMELGQAVREIINELQPRIVDEFGLVNALRSLAQSPSKTVACSLVEPGGEIFVPPFAANELYGICREIIADVFAPAGVTAVEIELEEEEGFLRLHLRGGENGNGRDSITEEALDAIAMRERLLVVDGTAELIHADTGAVITLSLPTSHPVPCADF